MSLVLLTFYAFAALAIGSALLLVTLNNTARALFLFFIVLFAMAGLYVFALADFVAITQILIYVGGVLILMLFAFMLSNKELLADLQGHSARFIAMPSWQSLLLSAAFLSILLYAFIGPSYTIPAWIGQAIQRGEVIQPNENTIEAIGFHMMTKYILAFEVISIFLLMALIGASHLSRKDHTA